MSLLALLFTDAITSQGTCLGPVQGKLVYNWHMTLLGGSHERSMPNVSGLLGNVIYLRLTGTSKVYSTGLQAMHICWTIASVP